MNEKRIVIVGKPEQKKRYRGLGYDFVLLGIVISLNGPIVFRLEGALLLVLRDNPRVRRGLHSET